MKRRRLQQTTAAIIVTSLLSTELTVFTAAQSGNENDQGSFIPPTLSPSLASATQADDSVIAPQPAVSTKEFRNVDTTPLPTYGMTFLATSIGGGAGASSPNVVMGGGGGAEQPPFVAEMQLSDKTCPDGSLDRQIVIDPSATLYYHLEPSDPGESNGILCGRLEVANNNGGWIGLGWSLNGNMIGGEAIIGLAEARSVLKYSLSAKVESGVTPMPAARQTLTNTSIRLVNNKTIMTFTKMLREINDEIEIYETGPNAFLHARGSNGQTLGYHDQGRVVFVKDFLDDILTDPPTPVPTPFPTRRPTPIPTPISSTVFTNVLTPNPTERFVRPTIPVFTPNPTERFVRPTIPVFTPNPTDIATTNNFDTGFRPTGSGLVSTPNPTEMFTRIPWIPNRTPNPTDVTTTTTNFGTGFQPAGSVFGSVVTPNPTDFATSNSVTGFRPTPQVVVMTPNPTDRVSTSASATGFRDEIIISTPSGRDPTMRPVPPVGFPLPVGSTNCNDPSITRFECRASIYCEWVIVSGERNYCQFGPPVPPTLRPTPRPTFRVSLCSLFLLILAIICMLSQLRLCFMCVI